MTEWAELLVTWQARLSHVPGLTEVQQATLNALILQVAHESAIEGTLNLFTGAGAVALRTARQAAQETANDVRNRAIERERIDALERNDPDVQDIARYAPSNLEPIYEHDYPSCPRHLVGLEHLLGPVHDESLCWCTSRLNDHGRHLRSIKPPISDLVIWQPYAAQPDELRLVLDAAEQDGLYVNLTGWSPWNPGSTFTLMFQRA